MLSCDGRSCLLQMSLEHRQIALSSSGFFCLVLAVVDMPNCQEILSQKFFAVDLVTADWAFSSECQGMFLQATCCSTAELQRCVDWCSNLLMWWCWLGSTSRLLQGEYCKPDLIAYDSLLLRGKGLACCWLIQAGVRTKIRLYSNTRQKLAWIPFCSIKLT